MKRWNPATRAWDIDYRPSKRQYPPLPLEIQKQLKAVEPTHDGMMEYFPCAVTLGTGEICECVYFANADSYIKFWGVWPDDDPEKRTLRLEDVTVIQPSAKRLPVQFAREMYAAGESRMGGCIFTLRFRDGSKQSYSTGNLVDFLEMPEGKMLKDVIGLVPHKGDEQRALSSLPYSWCLFGESEQKPLRARIFKK
jgi:hypothetical protein